MTVWLIPSPSDEPSRWKLLHLLGIMTVAFLLSGNITTCWWMQDIKMLLWSQDMLLCRLRQHWPPWYVQFIMMVPLWNDCHLWILMSVWRLWASRSCLSQVNAPNFTVTKFDRHFLNMRYPSEYQVGHGGPELYILLGNYIFLSLPKPLLEIKGWST